MEIKQLIIEAKAGDTRAFGQVYNEYLTPIYRYIYFRVGDKSLADDLTQEVFLKIFVSLDNLKISENSPLTYFYTVARNLLIDNYRKKKIPTMDDEEAENRLVEISNPENQAITIENSDRLSEALQEIPENEADVLVLKFIDDYPNREISKIMGKSEEAIRQLQSRGLKSLRKIISQKDFI
ncbi:MAG: RNA polymerase sigma factor [Minisyncoccia bacterium]